jgi:hypothetical protein
MTFAEQLKNHVGGLIRIKTDLYWYNTGVWDGIEGRVCLLLGTDTDGITSGMVAAGLVGAIQTVHRLAGLRRGVAPAAAGLVCALLLIDSESKWILTSKEDLELIQ